jgi:hypothetical protein
MATAGDARLRILGFSWILVAIGMTAIMGPHLGLRGWGWLLLHHTLMVSTLAAQFWGKRSKP